MDAPKTVAVLNTSEDTVELLRVVLESKGFTVVSAHVDHIRRGETSVVDFVMEHKPDALLYDIAPPYDRSFRFYLHLKQQLGLDEKRVVLTTTNKKRVEEIVGITDVHEIVGKPYDLEEIAAALVKASDGNGTPAG